MTRFENTFCNLGIIVGFEVRELPDFSHLHFMFSGKFDISFSSS